MSLMYLFENNVSSNDIYNKINILKYYISSIRIINNSINDNSLFIKNQNTGESFKLCSFHKYQEVFNFKLLMNKNSNFIISSNYNNKFIISFKKRLSLRFVNTKKTNLNLCNENTNENSIIRCLKNSYQKLENKSKKINLINDSRCNDKRIFDYVLAKKKIDNKNIKISKQIKNKN